MPALSVVPAAPAAMLDSVAVGLVVLAGLLWAGAVLAVSVAPAIPGRAHTFLNEAIACGLSTAAAIAATVGLFGALAG